MCVPCVLTDAGAIGIRISGAGLTRADVLGAGIEAADANIVPSLRVTMLPSVSTAAIIALPSAQTSGWNIRCKI